MRRKYYVAFATPGTDAHIVASTYDRHLVTDEFEEVKSHRKSFNPAAQRKLHWSKLNKKNGDESIENPNTVLKLFKELEDRGWDVDDADFRAFHGKKPREENEGPSKAQRETDELNKMYKGTQPAPDAKPENEIKHPELPSDGQKSLDTTSTSEEGTRSERRKKPRAENEIQNPEPGMSNDASKSLDTTSTSEESRNPKDKTPKADNQIDHPETSGGDATKSLDTTSTSEEPSKKGKSKE